MYRSKPWKVADRLFSRTLLKNRYFIERFYLQKKNPQRSAIYNMVYNKLYIYWYNIILVVTSFARYHFVTARERYQISLFDLYSRRSTYEHMRRTNIIYIYISVILTYGRLLILSKTRIGKILQKVSYTLRAEKFYSPCNSIIPFTIANKYFIKKKNIDDILEKKSDEYIFIFFSICFQRNYEIYETVRR